MDFGGNIWIIHRIKVNTVDALCNQIRNLSHRIGDPCFHRDMSSRQRSTFPEPVETVIVKDKLRNQMVGARVHLGL